MLEKEQFDLSEGTSDAAFGVTHIRLRGHERKSTDATASETERHPPLSIAAKFHRAELGSDRKYAMMATASSCFR